MRWVLPRPHSLQPQAGPKEHQALLTVPTEHPFLEALGLRDPCSLVSLPPRTAPPCSATPHSRPWAPTGASPPFWLDLTDGAQRKAGRGSGQWRRDPGHFAALGSLGWAGRRPYLRNIRQALQLVVLSNVYIWKLWWLALALSGLMFDLTGAKGGVRFPEPQNSRLGQDSEPGSARHPG